MGKQEGGTHADEIETSMILYMDPASVDMKKAVKDYHPSGKGGLTRDPTRRRHLLSDGDLGRSHACDAREREDRHRSSR